MSHPSRLSGRDLMALCAAALAMPVVMAALSCTALDVAPGARVLLSQLAAVLAALCVSIVLQDMLDPYIRRAAAAVRRAALLTVRKQQAL